MHLNLKHSEYASDSHAPIDTIVEADGISGDTYESHSQEKEFNSNDSVKPISEIVK